ncbi:unnamed protein product, partial [Ectocarpus fasciculatus]
AEISSEVGHRRTANFSSESLSNTMSSASGSLYVKDRSVSLAASPAEERAGSSTPKAAAMAAWRLASVTGAGVFTSREAPWKLILMVVVEVFIVVSLLSQLLC